MLKVKREFWLVVVALSFLAVLAAPPAAAGDHRVVAQLNEPFQINGELFPAGELSLRSVQDYSPVMTLNEVWVDGRCVGMLLARESGPVSRSSHDELVFARGAQGQLILVGVDLHGEPSRELFSFSEGDTGGRWFLASDDALVAEEVPVLASL